MLNGLYAAAAGIRSSEQQQEAIAQNLAHVNVPGYRRILAAFSTADAESDGSDDAAGGVGSLSRLVVDFSPGPVQNTGRPLDVALDGDGFLAIDSPRGTLYTRDGVMHIDSQGQLVNSAGFAYQGVSAIPPGISPGQLVISGDGRVSAGGQQFGQLRLVRFADNALLEAAGPTAFAAPQGVTPAANDLPQLQQGARELANVSATDELVRMLIGMRHHDAAQRALSSLDTALHENISGDQ